MSYFDGDWLLEVARGNVAGASVVHKFGRNSSVGTTFVPVSIGGVYEVPTSATTLRIKAGGNANDTAAGSGAREVTLIGLDGSYNEISEAVATNGASASSATSNSFTRLYRAYVSSSGTYANTSAGSHSASITIENGAGGTDWLTIDATGGFPNGQSEVAVYSVPTGYNAYIMSGLLMSDSSKTTDMILYRRENIDDTTSPYSAMRALFVAQTNGGEFLFNPESPIKVTGPADIGWMTKVDTGTAQVAVNFEMLVIQE